jgi:gluconate 2-dehydrogenase gamma chain
MENNRTRRKFLTGSAFGLGSAWIALHWPAILAAQQHAHDVLSSGQRAQFQFFSAEQAAEIEAVTAQIIPTDSTPGAREAHAVYFIDRALITFDRDKQSLYEQGLRDLPSKTIELFPSAHKFSELRAEEQIRVLTAIEQSEFFEQVRVHTVMGFLSNPEYGGNHDQVGWKAIDFEQSHVQTPPFGYYDAEYAKSKS